MTGSRTTLATIEAAVVAGRRTPALRSAIGRRVVATTARQAAAVGAVPLGGAAMPVLTLLQIKMIGQLATLHRRPPTGTGRVRPRPPGPARPRP